MRENSFPFFLCSEDVCRSSVVDSSDTWWYSGDTWWYDCCKNIFYNSLFVEFLFFWVEEGGDGCLVGEIAIVEWDDRIDIRIFEVSEIKFNDCVDHHISFIDESDERVS